MEMFLSSQIIYLNLQFSIFQQKEEDQEGKDKKSIKDDNIIKFF